MSGSKQLSKSKTLSTLFDKYQDPDDPTIISVEGTERLCEDLGIGVTDVSALVLAYYLRCENMCEFKKNNWISGWTELGCSNFTAMKLAAASFENRLSEPSFFKSVYTFTFKFALGESQKSLPCESAVALWRLLLDGRYHRLEDWLKFIEKRHGKAISKDTWVQFLDFTENIRDDLSNYEDDGAWPVLIDSFVSLLRTEEIVASAN